MKTAAAIVMLGALLGAPSFSAGQAGPKDATEAAPRRSFPPGFWNRTQFNANPACGRMHQASAAWLPSENAQKTESEVRELLPDAKPLQCGGLSWPQDMKAGFSPVYLEAWVDDARAARTKEKISKLSRAPVWKNDLTVYGIDPSVEEKWRLLKAEASGNAELLAGSPYLKALVAAEINRLETGVKAMAATTGKTHLQVMIYAPKPSK